MGFRPDFSLEHFIDETGLDIAARIPVNALGYWTLLRCRNNKRSTAGVAPMPALA
jgi:phosphatidylethanolamine/phosphatidyl-N-methylethanolamine N-methyltransferase